MYFNYKSYFCGSVTENCLDVIPIISLLYSLDDTYDIRKILLFWGWFIHPLVSHVTWVDR